SRIPFRGMEGISEQALEALAEAGRRAAGEHALDAALGALAAALGEVVAADAVAVRVADAEGVLRVRSVVSRSEALAAEVAGSSFSTEGLVRHGESGGGLPAAVARTARRGHAAEVVLLPVTAEGRTLGSVELLRAARPFEPGEKAAVEVAASQIGLVLRAFGAGNGASSDGALLLAGDALTA